MLGLGVQRCVHTAPVLKKEAQASQQLQHRVMSAAVGGGQDTEIPKARETSKLSPLGGTRIAGQEGVSLSLLDTRQSPESGNLPVD